MAANCHSVFIHKLCPVGKQLSFLLFSIGKQYSENFFSGPMLCYIFNRSLVVREYGDVIPPDVPVATCKAAFLSLQ